MWLESHKDAELQIDGYQLFCADNEVNDQVNDEVDDEVDEKRFEVNEKQFEVND